MNKGRVRIVRSVDGWVLYACPSEGVSMLIGRTRWALEAVRLAYRYVARFGGEDWVVECNGRVVDPPVQLDLGLEVQGE